MYKPTFVEDVLKINAFYVSFEDIFEEEFDFSGEFHDFWEVLCVLDGALYVSGDERNYIIEKNEAIFHKPMELHKFRTVENTTTHIFVTSFNLTGIYSEWFKDKICHFTPDNRAALDILLQELRKYKDDARIEGNRITYTPILQKRRLTHTVRNMCENFLISLYDSTNLLDVNYSNSETIIFNTAVNCMNEHLTLWMDTMFFAKECRVSLTQLKNIFSKYAGMGIHRYFLSMKLKKAAEMLSEGVSVSDTASFLGFSSQHYFSTVFKREIGCTPTEYTKGDTHI